MNIKQTLRLHQPGIVSVCREKSGNNPTTLYSCGADSNLGQWSLSGDTISDREITVDDQTTSAIACYDQYVYFGAKRKNQSGIIQHVILQKDLNNDEDLGRAIMSFSDEITSLDISHDGSYIIAGSADFKVKCYSLAEDLDSSEMWRFEMDGVVCHVAANPCRLMCAISASNGIVKIFNTENNIKEEASIHAFSPFNPRSGSSRMRMCWSCDGYNLYIPMEGYISVVKSPSWIETRRLVTTGSEDVPISDICVCARTLAASNTRNKIYVFNISSGIVHYEINCGKELEQYIFGSFFVTCISYFDDDHICVTTSSGDLFSCKIPPVSAVEDDENDITKVKTMFMTPEETFPAPDRSEFVSDGDCKFITKECLALPSTVQNSAGYSNGILCLKWNAFGRILATEVDNEPTIEITFNDTSIHEEIAIDNSLTKFVFGDLNNTVVALASQKNDKNQSELSVRHVGSWDRDSRLWSVMMNTDEIIESIAVGTEFIVVFTSCRHFRVFSATGVCRLIFSHAGPLYSIAAGGNKFVAVTCSSTLLINDGDTIEHNYNAAVYDINVKSVDVVKNCGLHQLALSKGSKLIWVALSPTDAVCTMDESFTVRYLANNGLWYQICAPSVREGHSIWPLAVNEKPDPKFKFIYCKSQQPSFDRNEIPQSIKWKLPICEEETDKGKLEQELLINELLQKTSNSINVDAEHSKVLMKYFALCCLKHRDARALDLASLAKQTQHLQFMCGYATKQGRNNLNNKIVALGRNKIGSEKNVLQPVGNTDMAPTPARQMVLQKRKSTNITRLVEETQSISTASVNINVDESSSLVSKKQRTVAENSNADFLDSL